MAVINVTLDTGGLGVLFKGIIGKLENPAPALEEIGVMMVARTQRGFGDGGRVEPWQENKQPMVASIAARVSAGKGLKPSHLTGKKKPLMDSGTLRQSITHRVNKNTVSFGTPLAYAALHQNGGTSTVENKIPAMLKGKNKRVQNIIKKVREVSPAAAGILSKSKTIKTKIPRRPFLVITQDDVDLIGAKLISFLLGQSDE